jgi:hypothetical protein
MRLPLRCPSAAFFLNHGLIFLSISGQNAVMKGGTYVFFLVRAIHSILLCSFKSTLIRIIAAIAFCFTAYPQGTVIFSTREPYHNVNAPFTLCSFWPQTTADFTAQLFLYDHGVYTPLYPATTFRTDSHTLSHYVVVPDEPVSVPGFPPGSTAPLYFRVWETAAGSFDAADPALRGESFANVILGGGTNPPSYLSGLPGFGLLFCPTTSVFTRGGITYFVLDARACPSLQVLRENDGKAFRIVPVPGNCVPETNQTPGAGFAIHYFLFGTLAPGTYKIFYDPLNPNTDVPFLTFDIAENTSRKTISNFHINQDGRVSFEVEGESHFVYRVQRSSDLETWTEIGLVRPSFDFIEPDPAPAGLPHYYKVQVGEPPKPTR